MGDPIDRYKVLLYRFLDLIYRLNVGKKINKQKKNQFDATRHNLS